MEILFICLIRKRQKRGEVYWVKDPKPIKPGIPIGRPGNILGLTDAL